VTGLGAESKLGFAGGLFYHSRGVHQALTKNKAIMVCIIAVPGVPRPGRDITQNGDMSWETKVARKTKKRPTSRRRSSPRRKM